MSIDPAPRFDPEAIARLRRFGGDALLFEMIGLLSAGGPARLAIARDAVGAGDCEKARATFHSLKSSTAQLGAMAMRDLCERAERAAAQGDTGAVARLLPELDAECAAMNAWMAAIRRGDA